MTLVPLLGPLEDENLTSWSARMAWFHAALPCEDWLKMLQISLSSVTNQTAECVDRFAGLTGVDRARVQDCGVQWLGNRKFIHRQETFGAYFELRTHTTYCPACLLEDSDPGSPSAGQRVGRNSWSFKPIRTCPRHGVLLYRRPHAAVHERFQNMNRVAPCNAELERQAEKSERRNVSDLQHYVASRFLHGRDNGWLDLQNIDQAVKACEMLGVCRVFGAHKDLHTLTMSQLDEAGHAGFEAASQGESGIRDALEEIALESTRQQLRGGPQALYGRLYQWLQFNKSQVDPGPIREVVRAHILDTLAVETGTTIFGEEVVRRRHSLRSLSEATGIHIKTLNRVLLRFGMIADEDDDAAGTQVTFDAEAGESLARRVKNSIPAKKIPEYLNCNRTQAQMMVRQGILEKLAPDKRDRGGVLMQVAIEDLDDFLDRLRARGRKVCNGSDGMVDMITASEIARQTVADIVRLVLDGRLARVEVLDEDLRFRSVLVDPDEVREVAAALHDAIGLSAKDVAARLGILATGVSYLRKTLDRDGEPFLRAKELKNARGTIRYRFAEEEVERFAARHIKLRELSKERGMSSRMISHLLAQADIHPIIDNYYLGVKVYRRADV